jgi:hypothetical protein
MEAIYKEQRKRSLEGFHGCHDVAGEVSAHSVPVKIWFVRPQLPIFGLIPAKDEWVGS